MTVFYVCGYDHYVKCGLSRGLPAMGVVAVARAGSSPGDENPSRKVYTVKELDDAVDQASSTLVRQAICDHDNATAARYVCPSVLQDILCPR